MGLPEPIKNALALIPPKWQTLVITPLLLMLIGGLAAYVYAGKTSASTELVKTVGELEKKEIARAAHEEDDRRSLRRIERTVTQLQRDFSFVIGDAARARDAQKRLDQMPAETR